MLERPGTNRRKAPRIECLGALRINPYPRSSTTRPLTVQCQDVSSSGIGIIHREALRVGKQFTVDIQRPCAAIVLYRVVRCRTCARGGFLIGARLERVVRMKDVNIRKQVDVPPAEPDAEAAAEVARLQAAFEKIV